MRSILLLINENIGTKRIHENLRNYKHKKKSIGSGFTEREMEDIYKATASGDGQDAYLNDGMWISPEGKIYDADR